MIVLKSILLAVIILTFIMLFWILLLTIICNISDIKDFINFIKKVKLLFKCDIYIFNYKSLLKIKFYKKGKCIHVVAILKYKKIDYNYIRLNISLSLKHSYCPISLLLINLLTLKVKEKIEKNDTIKITTENEKGIIKKIERENKLNSIL